MKTYHFVNELKKIVKELERRQAVPKSHEAIKQSSRWHRIAPYKLPVMRIPLVIHQNWLIKILLLQDTEKLNWDWSRGTFPPRQYNDASTMQSAEEEKTWEVLPSLVVNLTYYSVNLKIKIRTGATAAWVTVVTDHSSVRFAACSTGENSCLILWTQSKPTNG